MPSERDHSIITSSLISHTIFSASLVLIKINHFTLNLKILFTEFIDNCTCLKLYLFLQISLMIFTHSAIWTLSSLHQDSLNQAKVLSFISGFSSESVSVTAFETFIILTFPPLTSALIFMIHEELSRSLIISPFFLLIQAPFSRFLSFFFLLLDKHLK